MKRIKIKQLLQTANRLRTSRGFGVHSPFAYSFILNVLRNPYAYYSYRQQEQRHSYAQLTMADSGKIPPAKIQHLVFRIVNRFSPKAILQIGHECGLALAAALDASSNSTVFDLFIKPTVANEFYTSITETFAQRIKSENNIKDAVEHLKEFSGKTPRFILINNAEGVSLNCLLDSIKPDELAPSIYLFPTLRASQETEQLWILLNESLKNFGMTFTNDNVGIIVAGNHLPRQTYKLWL